VLSRALPLPIAIHESVKVCIPKPIGRNATDGAIVGQEGVGLLLREDSFGVQALQSAAPCQKVSSVAKFVRYEQEFRWLIDRGHRKGELPPHLSPIP
jgi:hypothetical protein